MVALLASSDPWWLDAAQVATGLASIVAIVVAGFSIKQSRDVTLDRQRERRRERIGQQADALKAVAETLINIRWIAEARGPVAEQQQRLRLDTVRAPATLTERLKEIADAPYIPPGKSQQALTALVDDALKQVEAELRETDERYRAV